MIRTLAFRTVAATFFLSGGLYAAWWLPGVGIGVTKHTGLAMLCGLALVAAAAALALVPGALQHTARYLTRSLVASALLILLLGLVWTVKTQGSLYEQFRAVPFESQSVLVLAAAVTIAVVALVFRACGMPVRASAELLMLGGGISVAAGIVVAASGALPGLTIAGSPFSFGLFSGFLLLVATAVAAQGVGGRMRRFTAYTCMTLGALGALAAFSLAVWVSLLFFAIIQLAMQLADAGQPSRLPWPTIMLVCVACVVCLTPQQLSEKLALRSAVEVQPSWSATLVALGVHFDDASRLETVMFGGGSTAFADAWARQQAAFGTPGGRIDFESGTSFVLTAPATIGIFGTLALLWVYAAYLSGVWAARFVPQGESNPLTVPTLYMVVWSFVSILNPVLMLVLFMSLTMAEYVRMDARTTRAFA